MLRPTALHNANSNTDLWPFELKNGTPLTSALEDAYTNSELLRFFIF